MDDLIIYGILAIVYLLFQVLGSRKKKTQHKPPQPSAPGSPGAEPTLDDALREIRAALGMGTQEPAPAEPVPSPLPAREPKPKPVPQSRLEKVDNRYETSSELIDVAPFKQRSRFKQLSEHYSDDEFEALKTGAEGFRDPHYRKTKPLAKPARPTKRAEVTEQPAAPAPNAILEKLRTPSAAREAFVLHEILGPPRSHRR